MAPYRGKHPNHGRKSKKTGGTMPAGKHNYVVPTLNHGDVLFTSGTTKDASEFKDMVQKLAHHVLTASGWKNGPALGKANDQSQGASVRQTGEIGAEVLGRNR